MRFSFLGLCFSRSKDLDKIPFIKRNRWQAIASPRMCSCCRKCEVCLFLFRKFTLQNPEPCEMEKWLQTKWVYGLQCKNMSNTQQCDAKALQFRNFLCSAYSLRQLKCVHTEGYTLRAKRNCTLNVEWAAPRHGDLEVLQVGDGAPRIWKQMSHSKHHLLRWWLLRFPHELLAKAYS